MEEVAIEAQPEPPVPRAPPVPQLRAWLSACGRLLVLRAPQWEQLRGGPISVALLVIANYLAAFILQRVVLSGDPNLNAMAVINGWCGIALSAWLCWAVSFARASEQAAPAPWILMLLISGSSLILGLLEYAVFMGLERAFGPHTDWPYRLQWVWWLAPMVWLGLMQIRLLWRYAATKAKRVAILVLTPLAMVVTGWLDPVVFWWPEIPDQEATRYRGLELTQEVVDAQPQLLNEALDRLHKPQPGRIGVFAVTYAPYAREDVFMRESAVVAKTLAERFQAGERTVQLVVNPATTTTLPWATPGNLHTTLLRMAAAMDKDRDVLFIHLTSHGGADGRLAVNTRPLESHPLTPQLLKQWLDEAGVRWRVISISACYSGSWIAPLAGEETLVMTAADATHTSYGCGSRSPLTFFGQAMYVDALQKTRSFEQAHAEARLLIDTREKEAGKTDGYSNPQISVGTAIRAHLQQLQGQLETP